MDLSEFKNEKWVKRKEALFIKEISLPKDCVGWLVVDSIGSGITSGGIRLGKKVDLEEVKLLAKEMTLKRLFYNQAIGGSKAGICCPNQLQNTEREEIFNKFGKALKPLFDSKTYFAGTDIGTQQKDIDDLYRGAGIEADQDTEDYIDSSYYTAVSVFSVLKSIVDFNKIPLRDTCIGIQGLGKVGLKLLHMATEHGLKLVAGSTQHGALYSPEGLDVSRIFDLARKHGDEFVRYYNDEQKINLDEFFEKEMDIMCPCAGIYPINKGNINRIKAKIIVPGCNVAANETFERQLYDRGITYFPGFVCNAGGVLGYTLKICGIQKNQRSHFLRKGIQTRSWSILNLEKKSKEHHALIARGIARRNQEKFILESKARAGGRLPFLRVRLEHSGTAEMLRTFLWSLVKRKYIGPNFVRKALVKKIVFDRLFKS